MNSHLETFVREVIRTADKNTSRRVEICTACEYEHDSFFHCGYARKALMKRNTSSVVGFTDVALYSTRNPFITAAATKISRPYSKQLAGNLPSTTVKFSAASNRMKVLGLR